MIIIFNMMYVRALVFALFAALPLFAAAGRWDPWLGAYVVGVWLVTGTVYTVLERVSPELVAERLSRQPNDRDRASRLVALPLMVAHYALAGLDARFGWSAVPVAAQALGLATTCGALLLVGWTLASNPYASSAVRIQSERGHAVVDAGPYGLVRHPMYLGVLLFGLASGIALGSWWAALPMLPVLGTFVRRTLLEDRMLRAELPGYSQYAARVRWRVVPGLF